MILNTLLLQIEKLGNDTIVAKKAESIKNAIGSWSFDDFIAKMIDGAITLGIRIIIAALVFYIGKCQIGRAHV